MSGGVKITKRNRDTFAPRSSVGLLALDALSPRRGNKKAGRFRVPPLESLGLPDALAPYALACEHQGYDHRDACEVEHFQPLSL